MPTRIAPPLIGFFLSILAALASRATVDALDSHREVPWLRTARHVSIDADIRREIERSVDFSSAGVEPRLAVQWRDSPDVRVPSADGLAVRLDGTPIDPLRESRHATVVLIFVGVDCPISNRYAPEIVRLARAWAGRGVSAWLVYPDASATRDSIRQHADRYALPLEALRDTHHTLVRAAGVTVTPEAAVFARGTPRYVGRIDDRAVDFGVFRPAAADRTLAVAVEAVLASNPIDRSRVPGVGCTIADLSRRP